MDQITRNQNYIKKRGVLLSAWLIIILIASFIGFLSFFVNSFDNSFSVEHPNIPLWTFYFMGLISFSYIIFSILIFLWKKWAIFAISISTIIAFLINIMVNSQEELNQNPFVGLLGISILVCLCLPKWKMFE